MIHECQHCGFIAHLSEINGDWICADCIYLGGDRQ